MLLPFCCKVLWISNAGISFGPAAHPKHEHVSKHEHEWLTVD
jgi:hypothetical protein